MSEIVAVKFQSKFNPSEFYGNEYHYRAAIPLKVGDIVDLPTKNGDGIGIVTKTGIPEYKVDLRVLPLLKTIERLHVQDARER